MGWGDTVGCQGFLCNISENALWRRASQWAYFSHLILTLCLPRLIKSSNTFFSPKQRGHEWKTTKRANALKTSMPSKLAFPQNRHSQQKQAEFYFFKDFSLLLHPNRDSERGISSLGSTCVCLLCTCACPMCAHRSHCLWWENMWERSVTVYKAGCFSSSSAFLCSTARTASSPISLF